jgi:transcriptional regulator with XRE-family HTH domain
MCVLLWYMLVFFSQETNFSGLSMTTDPFSLWLSMTLPSRLIALRKERGLSQQAMAEAVGIHANSWKKYESGQAQPSLDVLKKIAVALHVSTDSLLFEEHERGPHDELVLQFEAVSQLPPAEQTIVKDVLESLVMKYQSRRWDAMRGTTAAPAPVAVSAPRPAPASKPAATKRAAAAGSR